MAFLQSCTGLTALACWCPAPAAIDLIPTFHLLHTLSISADKFAQLPPLHSLTHVELIVREPLKTLDISPHPNLKNLGFLDFPGNMFIPRLLQDGGLELLFVLHYLSRADLSEIWQADDRVVVMSRVEVKYNALCSWKDDTLWPFAKKKRDAQVAKKRVSAFRYLFECF